MKTLKVTRVHNDENINIISERSTISMVAETVKHGSINYISRGDSTNEWD